jgi:tetratricopeptide (TPR) repeat protein
MKRIAIVFAFILGVGMVYAQKGKVTSALGYVDSQKLDKALETIKPALEHAKTKEWPRTYYVLGRIYHAIATTDNPEFKKLYEGDALAEALKNYQKAIEIDPKKRINKEVEMQYLNMQGQFINRGVEEFQSKKYAEASSSFEYSLEVGKAEVFNNAIDTAIIYNTGLAAQFANLHEKAIKYYKEAQKYGYGEGSTYKLISNSQKALGDTSAALATLQEGFQKYPSDGGVLIELINFYLFSPNPEDAFDYLKVAIEKEPTNATYHYALGRVYEAMKKVDEAIDAYKKAAEVDPTYFNAYYNLGVVYFNKAVVYYDNAMNIMDNKKYEAEIEKGKAEFKNSLPYMEKAHELDPTSKDVLSTLKTLYYRLQMEDKHAEIQEKLNNL